MNERRRANRVAFDGEATLIFQQDTVAVELADLSVMGAQVHSSQPLALPDASPVTLTITLEDSDIHLTLPGTVKRQQGLEIAVLPWTTCSICAVWSCCTRGMRVKTTPATCSHVS